MSSERFRLRLPLTRWGPFLAARSKRSRRPRAGSRGSAPGTTDAIEEELLASYLAGTLAADQRALVARYLATSPEAREVFSMALEAMRAERRNGD